MPLEKVRRDSALAESPDRRPSDGVVQKKEALRGLGFADQSAALAPEAQTQRIAERGTAGAGRDLPHLGAIQGAFGRHDVSGVQAHTGAAAGQAAGAMGAQAFAFGDAVAFDGAPDLHTAAHEAAHVVQQRAGISVDGGVGKAGDSHEQHADAVADAVVAGRSAEGLLDRYGGGGGGAASVQRKTVQLRKRPEVQPEDRAVRYRPADHLKVNVGKVRAMRNEWYDVAISLLRQGIAAAGNADNRARQIRAEHLIFALERQKEAGSMLEQDANVIRPEALQQIFDDTMPGRLTVMLTEVLGVDEDAMVTNMRESYIRMKNGQEWQTIQRTIAMRNSGGEGTTAVTSTITPVNQAFDATYDAEEGVEGKRFGLTGLGSMSPRLDAGGRDAASETHRPTNLWHSKLEDADGTLLFEAFRSGAFSDVAIRDADEQRGVGQAKALQVFEAMLIHRLKQVSDPAQLESYLTGGAVFNASVVAINLLSEAKAFGFGDKVAAQQHHAAIRALSGREHEYEIKRTPGASEALPEVCRVRACFRVLDFGAGVNIASGKMGLGEATINQHMRNDAPMAELIRDHAAWSARIAQEIEALNGGGAEADPERAAELQQDLVQARLLLAEIRDKGKGHVGDYKLPQLIANLAHLMGHLVHFNCKSGKDRTGIMDAKSKHLAFELERQRRDGGEITELPQLSRRDDDQEYRHQQMLWESGNLDVLKQNVGGQSLKVADMAGLPVRNKDSRLRLDLGGADALRELQGLKRYTNIDHGMKPGERGLTGKPKESSARLERARALRELQKMLDDTRAAFTAEQLAGAGV